MIRELLQAGLLHADIKCVHGGDLWAQAQEPWLDGTTLRFKPAPEKPLDDAVVRGAAQPFDSEGGLRRLQGNLGRAVVKISAVNHKHRAIEAPAKIFESQDAPARCLQAQPAHRRFRRRGARPGPARQWHAGAA